MCGFVGFVDKAKDKKKIIKDMSDKIIHRGPDDYGYYTDNDVALGHRRLSIIDLKNGKQPIFNEDKSKVIIELPSPTHAKGVQVFMGHCGYYHKFIYMYAVIAKPLYGLIVVFI